MKNFSHYLRWLALKNQQCTIYSNTAIQREIRRVDLKGLLDDSFFLPTPEIGPDGLPGMKPFKPSCDKLLRAWAKRKKYSKQHFRDFIRTDFVLVNDAYQYDSTLVSMEHIWTRRIEGIKIPDVCEVLEVPYLHLFKLFEMEKLQKFMYAQMRSDHERAKAKKRRRPKNWYYGM